MREDEFRVFVEQLRDGHVERISQDFDSSFIDVAEKDLSFSDPVNIQGDIYLAGDALILHLSIATTATMPCLVCNEPVKVEIEIPEFYHMEPLEEIKSAIYNFKDVVREAILLQAPLFAECDQGSCPKRKEVQKFMAKKDKDEGYHPFADL